MIRQDQKEIGAMRTPHRRDVSARQDLLGRELRQLFADYSEEDMPEELRNLAMQLQSAVESQPQASAAPPVGLSATGVEAERSPASTGQATVSDEAPGSSGS